MAPRSKATATATKGKSVASTKTSEPAPKPKAATVAKADSKSKAAAKPVAAKKAAPKKATTAAAAKASKATATKAKTTATKKAAPAKKPTAEKKSAKNANGKRQLDDADDKEEVEPSHDSVSESEPRPKKKARVATADPEPAPTGWRKQVVLKRRKRTVVDNPVPTAPLDVFVFGEGSSGELGLGSKKNEGKRPIDVKRPRLNHNLDAEKVGIVDVACGGMHAVALTKDNRVLTWGVNDDKALGRDTTWDGGVRDADAEDSDSDDDDDTGVNPLESTPAQIEKGELEDHDVICKVAATDSASFLLTTDGFVFGWGTFRGADGIIGFAKDIRVQPTPMLIAPLQDITNIACGSNHVIAVDIHGKVWTWGSGGQYQLGRKPITRHGGPTATLQPQPCGMFGKRHYAVGIAAGSYHSFYIDNNQRVWSWGLNNYSQTGHFEDTGKDDAMILQPKMVESLKDANIKMIAGGEHHSVARTGDGKLLTWGRVDGHQVGQPASLFTEDNSMFDENGRPRILLQPTPVPEINTKFVAAGVDTSFVIDNTGHVYSWGFSANYQTGQGTTDDIEVPTKIDNTAIRDRDIIWAGAGGQYSMLAAKHDSEGSAAVNGN
ncbi:putative rcc1 domain-containing protein [Rosellinia necatrix]|uniref:Putative rcc1 domain-containing protein n=1 Tax=Rosellinia necatrix TaxID=77044 RepID=A0A1W2TMA8_ROSNE|nr:putative rcc1 domain-containing protein [Rosellinia necatrix]